MYMIQKVSLNFPSVNFSQNRADSKFNSIIKNPEVKEYADSFCRHAKESTPMLLGLTALWAALDYGSTQVPIQKTIKNNLKGFFLPVLVASSALLATIEMKKTSKSSNS